MRKTPETLSATRYSKSALTSAAGSPRNAVGRLVSDVMLQLWRIWRMP